MSSPRTSEQPHSSVILLVDDDAGVRRAMSTILEHAGHEVIAMADGESALEIARERVLDLALVDRCMAGIDGITVLQRLRELQPMCTRVLLSGSIDLDTALDAVNLGSATHVLGKPIGVESLLGMVEASRQAQRRMLEAYSDLQRVTRTSSRARLSALLMSTDLRLALQPIVSADGRIVAYEALLRSMDPMLNGPLPVLRAAEEHGMVGRLGGAVLTRAKDILDRLPRELQLFINLHPHELGDPDALADRVALLQGHEQRVVFEITERSALADATGWEQSIDALLRRGFTLAVDDLGSGYSSLSVLAELQPRFIKIDMSIVRDIDTVARKQRLFDLLCRFADATDTLVVAEGIETPAEADTVRRCGAHLMQGYHFARPELSEAVLGRYAPERAA